MQVILKQNVPRLGKNLEVVEVSNGYANNYLFPRDMAEPATKAKVAELEKRRDIAKAKEEAFVQVLTERLEGIKETPLTLTVRSDEQGNLYKKVHASDIASGLQGQFDIELGDTSILLDTPIDKTGEYNVDIEFGDVRATIDVHVVRESK